MGDFAICKRGLIDMSKQCLAGCVMQLKKSTVMKSVAHYIQLLMNSRTNRGEIASLMLILPIICSLLVL